ncbi:hypothetical protein FB45DRAFT_1118185 [Roridomyces roridus]|uniref:F-box domain-containing protein n=1 Tax=Roridomyces roridus TaxID=1738132 RepID=A0AAD7B6S3_9AGAR|nr:hypothetical protein FB45DRAFT_1118185 [Roridomyces roridus]
MAFLDLPLDLLSDILSHLIHPQHIASACRVNRYFNHFATPKLYERASIYSWHKRAKAKVVSLFNTLSGHPQLAEHIRDFPKYVGKEELEELVITGLQNCVNLRSCTWTRDGALNSGVLRVLQACATLEELEINGHSDGHYDALILQGFSHLRRISLIMPSADVVNQLAPWMNNTGASLSSLTLICKMSPRITDNILEVVAPSLASLSQFSIAGCPRVTHTGIWAILSNNTLGLQSLSLEALSTRFDLDALCLHCAHNPTALSRLTSLTLSIHSEQWLPSILALLAPAPLVQLQLYASSRWTSNTERKGAEHSSTNTDTNTLFWRTLLDTHAHRLQRVSVHRMPLRLGVIKDICTRCVELRQLFVAIVPEDLSKFAACLVPARKLVSVHVNFPGRSTGSLPSSDDDSDPEDQEEADDEPDGEEDEDERTSLLIAPTMLKAPEALAIVRRCPESIALFGCNSRVWQVGREIRKNETTGEVVAERYLARYEMSDIPEQFLVVRT